MPQRIGIFGGSFDPVHLGHLWIAEAAREQLSLDQVRWIPAATSPLKPDGPVASDDHRLQMVRLAISGNPFFVLDDREIARGEVSYTVDTVAEIQKQHPDDELFLIVGSDSLASFDRWHQPSQLLELATLAVIQRGGDAEIDVSILKRFCDDARLQTVKNSVVPMPLIEVSSTDLRRRILGNKSVRYQVPAAVEAFIRSEKPYQ
ncbi:Nicotinate-nucleotide adenylyltransferase [Rubripirellula obstinata]|uniref:Probable nicotinate-nucleotide adenylyltransferase n=1 Tax=Rubripirellula obstinata TaxID=406547 RepID=A0A5B1CHT4_9BACT|nr:nicotinate-nucleotide adenylyltransferase [Rubripirellula obstinata]KAA1260757.1 Nicotinate-nucleotide adenylyltransferase [Rubripirellula obstinata]